MPSYLNPPVLGATQRYSGNRRAIYNALCEHARVGPNPCVGPNPVQSVLGASHISTDPYRKGAQAS
eukprot:7841805-Pyramimonas_sp.AAC.1